MSIILYTKPGCTSCEKAKLFLATKNLPYVSSVVGQDILREDFISMFPEQKTVPLIIVDGVKVNGYEGLVEWYNNRQQFLTE